MVEDNIITYPRQEFLKQAVNVAELKGLEIGALDEPLVKKEDTRLGGRIFYLDHLPTEELCKKYEADPSVDVDNIVPVDFFCRNGNIVEATGGIIFDYVVASHVIEHTPNLLQFLIDIHKILKPGGQLILIIPDKRFTFDVNRPVTTFGEALEKYCTNETKPSISAVYDHFALANATSGHNVWYGSVKPEDNRLLASEQFAWQAAQSVLKNGEYFDVHVNIFTPASFFEILRKAISYNLVEFEVEKFSDTAIGQIEFMVALKKNKEVRHKRVMAHRLSTIPKFNLESQLSPYMPQVKALSEALETSSKTLLEQQIELGKINANLNNERETKMRIQEELGIAQRVLDRKSVRFALATANILFKFFQKVNSRKAK